MDSQACLGFFLQSHSQAAQKSLINPATTLKLITDTYTPGNETANELSRLGSTTNFPEQEPVLGYLDHCLDMIRAADKS